MDSQPKSHDEIQWSTFAKHEHFSSRERRAYLLLGAWAGTMLAGGVFVVVLFVWEIAGIAIGNYRFESFAALLAGIVQLRLGILAGFVLGCLWASVLGAGSFSLP